MTKRQVADFEKLPPESPLLQLVLNKCPSKPRNDADWREAGEQLYYYAARKLTEGGGSFVRQPTLARAWRPWRACSWEGPLV